MNRFIVMHACAKMPNCCWGEYRRVAVVEVEAGFEGYPSMIAARARGVVRVVATWERLNVGTTDRCAFRRALREARELAHTLNAELAATVAATAEPVAA